ncbi:efflux RND transporter periplasmic adaptor subunit [Bacillus sp. MRMR6]|uniref:efflux RND transporter periplasmic adaptor subunit n=1 Tax=Bacillus sp. MRMR6 TaxID=1928617 RepID=UPI0020C9B8E4|nr:biotin/lipoyl-binding protein [Bacillus sp. MRMR6]
MKMKKKGWIWSGVTIGVLLLAVGGFFAFKSYGSAPVDTEAENAMPITVQKVKEQELTDTILVTGKIVPEEEQKIFLSPENGEIVEYKVEENQTVEADQVLFVYDTTKLDSELKKAKREKELIQKRLKTEKDQIAQMNSQITAAKKNGDPQEIITELEKEKINIEMQYESTSTEVENSQERINELEAQKKSMEVKSKINGIIVKVNKNVAKTETGSQEPVIHIISNQPYKVIGTMSEFDTVKVQPNQPVIIRPKVYKDRVWNGVVESVSQFPEGDAGHGEGMYGPGGGGNVTMYPFKVAITDDTSELRQGFHVSLEVNLSSGEKHLVVPAYSIWEVPEEGIQVVYVLKDGILQRKTVETGAMGDEFIQIISGVALDELVVLGPTEEMFDGMEVTNFDEVE